MTSMRRHVLSQLCKITVPFAALALLVAGCSAPAQDQPTVAPTQPEIASSTPFAPTDTPKPATPIPTEVAVPTETTTATAISATGQTTATIAGTWEGEINLPNQSFKIIVSFKDQDGQLSGSIRIPAQLAADIPLHDVRFESPQLHFEMLSGPQLTVFDGELQPDGSISGSFTQSGYPGDFTLSPQPAAAAEATAAAVEVVPYRQEEVTFKNGDATLAGTLTLPEGKGPFPAVILVSGSGQQNRDEEIAIVPGYKPFQVIADTLTRQGIAVLRYDDRGVGQSTGDPSQATTIDFAADAEAGINALLANPEIDPKQVGVFGHSEGGIIAAMLAARNPNVAFVIGMAAPAVRGDDLMVKQTERVAAASGLSAEEVAKASEQKRQILDLAIAKDWQGVEEYLNQIAANQIPSQVNVLKIPWMQTFLTYDPGQDWAKVTVPVLALFGGLDVQVDVDQNRPTLEAALKQAKNPDVTVKVFPDANHLFLQAKTGGLEEYATLPTDFVPGFLDTIADWLLARVKVND